MVDTFDGATSFDQNIGSWNLRVMSIMRVMFYEAGMSPTNYDLTLDGWSKQPNASINILLGPDDLKYYALREAARMWRIVQVFLNIVGAIHELHLRYPVKPKNLSRVEYFRHEVSF